MMLKIRHAVLTFIAVAHALSCSSHAQILLVNGDFESPAAPDGDFITQIPQGWSSLGNGSTTDIIHTGYGGSFASSGEQFVDLIGGGFGTFPSGLVQTVTLVGGITYRLDFDYNGARYNDGSQTVGAILEYSLDAFTSGGLNVDGLNVFSANGPTTPWQRFSTEFLVSNSGDYVLKFQTQNGAFSGAQVDNVSLTAIPEPSRIAMLLASLLLGWTFVRSKR